MSAPILQAFGGSPGEPLFVPKAMIPVGRIGDALDMGGTMLYLASRAGAYCNGNIMVVDGGRLGAFPSSY